MAAVHMTEGSITRHLVHYSVPLILGNLFQLTYNVVDSIIAGRFIGKEALAAEGIPESDFAALCTEPPSEERPDGLYTLRYGEIQIMAIAKIQQMAAEIAELKEQVAALSAGKE